MEITLNYNNNEFLAYITGEKESREGFDNFQQEEILKDILEYMETYNGPHHSYEYSYNGYKCGYLEQESYIYENIYYDGNNIKDFVDNIKLRVDYIQNSNLNNLNNNITSLFDKGILSIYNFKNIDLYEEYSELFMPYTVQDNRISKYVDDAYYLINGRIVTSDKNS